MDRPPRARAAEPTGRRLPPNPFAPSREALIDRQIREAMEAGKFDDLPFRGERIPLEDDSAAGDMALAHHILRNAHMAPPWIETDREVRALLDRRDAILARAPRSSRIGRERDRSELRRLVEQTNRAIAVLNGEAPTDRQHRRLLRVDEELGRLADAHAGEASGGSADSADSSDRGGFAEPR